MKPPALNHYLSTPLATLALGIMVAAAWSPCRAQPCVLSGKDQSVLVGESAAFEIVCPPGAAPLVSWEFGDGTPETAYGPDLEINHAYAAPGNYNVSARLQGEPFPMTTTRSVVHPPTAVAPTHSSTIVYDAARRRVFAVNPDHHTVSAVAARSPKLLFEAAVGKHPRTLALDAQGNVWVACQDDATIHVLSGEDGSNLAVLKLPFGSRPYGIVFAPGAQTAYVSLEATGRLAKLDPSSLTVSATLDLGPGPRGIAVSHDGKRILVTRHLSPMEKPGAADHGEVWEVDGAAFARVRTFRLEADTSRDGHASGRGVPNGLSSVTISPDGRYALVPGTKANTQKGMALDGTLPDFQTTARSVVARIDLIANREDMADRKDVDNRSLPSSATFDRIGRLVFLTTQGTNKTPVLLSHRLGDLSAVMPLENSPEALARGEGRELSPIGSVLDEGDSLLFIHYFLSREIGVHDVSEVGWDPIWDVALVKTVGREVLPPQVLLGKQIFYNAADIRMSEDGYLTCVVCHIDGGGDGRVWDFTHKGEGLRRTTDLRGKGGMGQGPVHWSANFDEIQDFENDIRGPFAGRGFLPAEVWSAGTRNRTLGDRKTGLSPELDALAAYVSSLGAALPSPYRNADGTLGEAGKRGRTVFQREDVGCAKCHSGKGFTDSRLPPAGEEGVPGPVEVFPGAASHRTAQGFLLHDVGTRGPFSGFRMGDTLIGLDTPTLKGIWTGGPYLHDGSAPSLKHVLETANPDDRHGKTSHLSAGEKEDLLAYLNQLDDLDDEGVAVRASRTAPGAAGAIQLSAEIVGGRVRIHFRMPDARKGATGTLFDLQGAQKAVFKVPAGVWEGNWSWGGKDARGGTPGTGLYLVRLTAHGSPPGSHAVTRFMLP